MPALAVLLEGVSGLQLVAILVVVVVSSAVQSAVGFGAGVVAIPLFVWLGIPLPSSIALMYGVVAIHVSHNLWLTRKDAPFRDAAKISLLRWAALPLGVYCLHRLVSVRPDQVRALVGSALLAVLLLRRRSPSGLAHAAAVRPPPGPAWFWLAGGGSGFMAGLVGMGGPALVLYSMRLGLRGDAFRSYLWACFVFGCPVGVAFLAQRFGLEVLRFTALGAAAAPCVWLGSRLGRVWARNWSAAQLQLAVTSLLYWIAIGSCVAPWLAGD